MRYDENTLKEIHKQALKEPIHMVNGKCSQCGACCTHHLPIMSSEIIKIKDYIKAHNVQPHHHNKTSSKLSKKIVDFQCPFLDNTGSICKCTIYDVRPGICKFYTCDINHDEKKYEEAFEKAIASKDIDPMEIMLNQHNERNIGQLFYPDEYEPDIKDLVVVNQVNMTIYMQYHESAFLCMNKRKINGKTQALIVNTDERLWTHIENLTKIEDITP